MERVLVEALLQRIREWEYDKYVDETRRVLDFNLPKNVPYCETVSLPRYKMSNGGTDTRYLLWLFLW